MNETCISAASDLLGNSDFQNSGSGIDVLVHEIAHQWWGLTTIPVSDEASYWSREGITCYSTYRFMAQYFGEQYAKEHFIDKWQEMWKNYKNAFYVQHPEYFSKLSQGDRSTVMASLSNIGNYGIMPLQLLKAENILDGQECFQKKLSELYKAYLGNSITYGDFLSATGLTEEVLNLE